MRARDLEAHLSKDQILDLYLQLAPYGGNIEGVRAASLAYFGKEPTRLTMAEAALLVALPQSPEARRPDRDANAARDARLLAMLKRVEKYQPKDVKQPLDQVIEAAEIVDTARIRTEALAAIENLKRNGPDSKRNVAWWGQVGEGAIAAGCLGAAVAGAVVAGLPCVVGGAVSSAAMKMWARQD